MTTRMKNKYRCLICCGIAATFMACSEWSDHYEDLPTMGNGQTVMQLLEQQTPSFAEQVRQAGYGKLLASSQSFTVFAPAQIEHDDDVQKMVANHIARRIYPTSTPSTVGVEMLNGKLFEFDTADRFGGTAIEEGNLKASNGLVHRLATPLSYVNNIYEHLKSNPEYSKLYDFIHAYDEVRFNADASVEIDIDEEGRPVYDSVMVDYNRLLEHPQYGIGHIAKEDSAYIMVVPTNTAWDEAYQRIAPSFKVYDADAAVADSLQDIRTKLAIVEHLIYRDTVPSGLKIGASAVHASNGTVLSTPVLKYNARETWNKPIMVEAEQQNGRTYNNTLTSVYNRYVTAASLVEGVSHDSYVEVMPISTSTNPTVIFEIPKVLAGTYNVYAVFLPVSVEGAAEQADSTRMTFTVTYQDANGRSVSKRNNAKSLLTEGSSVTKMLAFENLVIPVSNTSDRLWMMGENHDDSSLPVTTLLTVATNVTAKEFSSGELSRSFRLDCIIFEPVED